MKEIFIFNYKIIRCFALILSLIFIIIGLWNIIFIDSEYAFLSLSVSLCFIFYPIIVVIGTLIDIYNDCDLF